MTHIAFPASGRNENRTVKGGPATVFDFEAVAPDVAAALRKQGARILERISSTTDAIVQIGRDLLAVKDHLDHGLFEKWLRAELRMVPRTAQRYMRAAAFAEGKNDNVSLFAPATLYLLAAKSTPPEIVNDVLDRARNGDVIADVDVREMVDEARCQRRREARQQQERDRRARMPKRRREEREAREAAAEQERAESAKAAEAIARKLSAQFGSECVSFLLSVRGDLYLALEVLEAEAERQGAAA
jgi:hypothetical protein